jgi:hypothetical protein
LTNIDNDLGVDLGYFLQVQIALSSVELTQHREIIVFGIQILLGSRIPFAGKTNQHIGSQSK